MDLNGKKVSDPRVVGYNFYRTELDKGSNELKLVKVIDNKYATHYVDKGLEPKQDMLIKSLL